MWLFVFWWSGTVSVTNSNAVTFTTFEIIGYALSASKACVFSEYKEKDEVQAYTIKIYSKWKLKGTTLYPLPYYGRYRGSFISIWVQSGFWSGFFS